MAKYANPEAAPAEDNMYEDAAQGMEHQDEPDKPQDKEEGKSYLIPKGIAMGKQFEPGDEIVLRIVAEHDDQFEVEYAPDKEQEGKEKGSEPMAMEAEAGKEKGGGDMASLYE